MKKFSYDIEVFPNFFSATFLNSDNESEKHVFVIADKRNDIKSFTEFLDQELTLIGFNNIMYDGAVMHLITETCKENPYIKPNQINPEIFRFSSNLINSDRMMSDAKTRNHQRPDNVKYKQIDLMKLMAFDKLGVSLKQISINLLWHKVQDLPLPYDHIVQPFEYQIILDYNLNDVLITQKLYKSLSDQLELREKLSAEYGVDLMSASDSKMADVILEDLYCKKLNIQSKEIRNLRTKRDSVCLGECLGKNITFKTNILNRIKREIQEKIVHFEDNYKYNKTVKFSNASYELGVGGLHSVDDPAIFVADENNYLRDADVSSYYPSIMIINNLYPEHLDPKFVDILQHITNERLAAKKSGDKIKADSLKITINSIFGKLGSDTFWLYDPKKMLSVTVSGQLYLLMLIESLVLEGIEVISANTDGIVSRIPKHLDTKYQEICNWWQEKTGFGLEFTEYAAYYRSDVNNYITVKPDGKTKEKGRYLKEVNLKKGYKYPIIPNALYNYFVKKTPIMQTLKECKNIFDFCVSQKVGGDFVLEYRKDDGITRLQKNNRFFISTDGGKLIKRRTSNDSEIGLYVGKLATIINDYDASIPFEHYSIDYSFYEEEALKYISEIENNNNRESFSFIDEPENYIPPEMLREAEREHVVNILKGIKGIPDKLIDNLAHLHKNFQSNDFLDLLIYSEDNSLMSSRFKDLIKINYFCEYGSAKKLLTLFEEFTKGKNRYNKTLSDKSKVKRLEELRTFYEFQKDEQFSIHEQIKNEVEIAECVKTKFEVDKKYAYVLSIEDKYTPKIELQSLAVGTKNTVKISKKIFNQHPLSIGDIILCKEFKKKCAMKKNDNNEWEEIPDRIDWWLETYYVMKPEDEFVK
jgi:hypothetical protein